MPWWHKVFGAFSVIVIVIVETTEGEGRERLTSTRRGGEAVADLFRCSPALGACILSDGHLYQSH